jgi:hypothetical protein
MRKIFWQYVIVALSLLLFPLFLNWILLQNAIVPVVGNSVVWLSFWPVYLSAIASFGMIYYTYRSLQQNKLQLEEMKAQREEEERARLVFSVIVYQTAFMLKISNIGKRNVFNAIIHFNEDFLDELMEEHYAEGYKQLAKPFFVEAGTSRHLFIGFCQDVNDAWKNKNVVIKMKGSYNDVYEIDEELNMSMFLDKTFMLVQGDWETTMGHIKKGLVVQNNSYMPVQRSLDQMAKSIKKVESSLESIVEKMEEKEEIEGEHTNMDNSNEDEQ